ncbi:MAG TPA: Ig-like domain-containing protein [Tepidisphaeraceae bacterium]|jgi:hypothetical protein
MFVSRFHRVARRLSRASVQKMIGTSAQQVYSKHKNGWRGIETLETRRLLSADVWTGNAHDNNWATASNWQSGTAPATGDTVTIGSGFTAINIASGTISLNSLTTQSPITMNGGTLSVSNVASFTANLTLNGGTINNTVISFSNSAELIASTSGSNLLSGDTVLGTIDLSKYVGATVQVNNGLVMSSPTDNPSQGGQILIGDSTGTYRGNLNFGGTVAESITGNGGVNVSIIFGNNASNQINNNISVAGAGTAVTLGSSVTVSGTQGIFRGTYTASEYINQGTIESTGGNSVSVSSTLLNQGTIGATGNSTLSVTAASGNLGNVAAMTDASTINLSGTSYTINDPVNVSKGTLTIAGTFTNSSTISLTSAATMNLTLTGTSSNVGVISENASTLNLRGDFAQTALGTISRTGGTINLIGTLENTGGTLALTSTSGPWYLDAGTIKGGTISESGTGQLLFTTQTASVLNGVTIDGNLDLSEAVNVTAQVQGGLVLGASPDTPTTPGQILIGNAAASTTGTLQFTGTTSQTVAPASGLTAQVVFGGTSSDFINNNINNGSGVGGSIIFAPGVTIDGKYGQMTSSVVSASSLFVNEGTIDSGASGTLTIAGNLQNQGTIEVDNGSTLTISAMQGNIGTATINGTGKLSLAGSYTNNLGLSAPSGSTLTLAGTWTNAAPITATSATLSIGGTFSNNSTISATNTTTSLAGTSFTVANLGTFNRSGGTVYLTGTLSNVGATLALNSTTGPWILQGGTLTGGTISESGTGQFIVYTNGSGNNTLDGVTVLGNLDVSEVYGAVTQIKDGLTIGSSPDTPTTPSVILLGNSIGSTYGELVFVGTTGQTVAPVAGSTMEIRFGALSGSSNELYNSISNAGNGLPVTLAAGVTVDGNNGALAGASTTSTFTNQGAINASGGGTINVSKPLTNQGTLQASNGTLSALQLTNLSGGTLTGGNYEADAHATLALNGFINTDAANVVLDGTSSNISDGASSALLHLNAVSAGATFSLRDGQSLSDTPTTTGLTNDGTIGASSVSTLSVAGTYTQNADGTFATQLTSPTSVGKVTSTGVMTLNGTLLPSFAAGYDPASSVTFTVASGSSLSQNVSLAAVTTPSGRGVAMHFNSTSAIVAVLPLAPSTPHMTAASDHGISNTDGITNDNAPDFTGTAQDAGSVELFTGNTLIGTASISSGAWTVHTSTLADGTYQVTAKVVDTAGDIGPASAPLTIVIDTVAPTIAASINAPASTGWYNIATGAATVTYTASDNAGGSGLASAAPNAFVFGDGANQSVSGVTIFDIAGNSATSQGFTGINQDTVAPTVTDSITAPASNGWYNIASGPAVVTYSASDNAGGSGLVSVPANYTFSDGTNEYVSPVTITDIAGNSTIAPGFLGVNQDTVAPTITANINAPASTGWYNISTGPATVSYSASDNGSGLASAVPGSVTLSDGANQSVAAVTIYDNAGNSATSQSFSGINQDTVAPTISASINSDASTGWYNISSGAAMVTYTASDNTGGSGLASAIPGAYTFSDGANQSLAAVTISDIAGNTATSPAFSGINQDTVAPTISASISTSGSTGWYNIASGPAVVTYSASDSGSGLASAIPGTYTFADGANQSLAGVTITDIAGNTATSPAFNGINQDTVAPTITATINSDASTGWYNISTGPAVVTYAASDNAGGSGLFSAVPAAYTFSDGANESVAAVTISDIAGNTATSAAFTGIDQDTVAPTISATISAPSATTGWYNIASGPAVVTYSASDNGGGSGLASATPGAYTFADGGNQSLAGVTIYDIAGNSATSPSFAGINQDTVAPTISASISLPGSTGWYNIASGPAVVTYSASDNAGGSGLASAVPSAYTFADGSNQSLAAATISDIAGNTATSQSFGGINQDTVAPTISASINAAASTGWYNIATGPAVVTYSASDSGSGLAAAVPGAYTFADGANQSLAGVTISDIAGNTATSQAFSAVNQDTVAPAISASINAPASTGWYNIASGPAVVTYSATDSGSGLASATPGSVAFSDGANQSLASVTIYDNAGNSATSQSFSGINQDTIAPTISANINAPAATGWYNIATGPAVVTYSASDSGSGLASAIPGAHTFADGANQSLAAVTISDIAGNSATSPAFSSISQDTVAPTITANITSPASTGWYNIASGPAVVSYSASDSGSGLASAAPGAHTFADGSNESLAGVTIYDVAGNSVTSPSFLGINQDTVAPTINATINAPASTGWYNIATGAAVVNYTASDSGSGLASAVPAAHAFADGANQSLSAVTISDIAGNTATSQAFSGISQDTVAPTINAQRVTAANANGWNNTNVTASYSASDTNSGINATASSPISATVSTEGVNQSVTFTAYDVAGNSVSSTVSGINIDKTPPTLTATVNVPPASTGWYNIATGAPVVSFAASDSLSGIDTTASGSLAPVTLPQGTNVGASKTVYDLAGNSATAGVSGLKVDLTAPTAPAAPTVTLSGATPTYSGTAEANSTVNIYADGGTTPVATVVASSTGTYSIAGAALTSGTHSITAKATDVAGNASAVSQATSVTVSTKASVVNTSVQWGTVGTINLVLNNGFLLPIGRKTDLPWIGIDSVTVTLSQSAKISASDVSVTGVNIKNYGPVTVTGSGTTYTITFARAVNDADRLTITIGNKNVNTFTAQMNILPGDVNDDGSVTVADVSPELEAWLQINGAQPTVWEDINGDGVVDLPDVIDTLISLDEHLPPQ